MRSIQAVFVRYTIIFTLFSALLLMLFTPLYLYMFNYTKDNEISKMADRLSNGLNAVDSTAAVLSSMVQFIGQDSRFRAVNDTFPNAEKNPYTLSELRGIFGSFLHSQSLIADAGIIFSQDIILTTDQLFYYTDYYAYYNQFLSCERYSWDEWIALLMSDIPFGPARLYKSTLSGDYKAITFSARWSGAKDKPALIFATLPVNGLVALAADNETATAGIVRIYDSRGTILYESDKSRGEYCHIISAGCSRTSLHFEVGIPDSIINVKVRPVKNLIYLFALISAILGISLALVFAHKSSAPMRRFLASLEGTKNIKNQPPSYFQGLGRIYADLAASINVIDERLESSLRTIERQTQIMRSQIFDRAIHQGIYNPEENELFRNMFPDFPARYQLGVIHYDSPPDSNTAAVQITLISLIKTQLGSLFVQGSNSGSIALLLPLNRDCADWYGKMQSLRNALNRESDLSLAYGLSDVFFTPQDLVRAWNQLQFIQVAAGISDLISVQEIKDFPISCVRFPLDINMLQMIYNALSNGNDSTACAILLKERWDTSSFPEEQSVVELSYMLLKDAIMLLKMKNPSLLFDVEIPVYTACSPDELFSKQFPECFKQIASRIRDAKQNSISGFGRMVLDFINEHLYEPKLYIKMVCDHFNISAPTLQKLIKPITGKTFLAYVEEKRLGKAKEMIASGNYTVTESARASGFSNKNSFYVAFKKAYGFRPSDIRGTDYQNRS